MWYLRCSTGRGWGGPSGHRGRCVAAICLDGRIQVGGDLADTLLCDTLADGGHLGHNGITKRRRTVLLGRELLSNDRGDSELVKDGLLGDQSGDGLVDRGGQASGALLQSERIGE